jgi:hypothetical protein
MLILPVAGRAVAKVGWLAAIILVLQFGYASYGLAQDLQDDCRRTQQQNASPDPRFAPEAAVATGGTGSTTTSNSSIAQQIQAATQSLTQQIQQIQQLQNQGSAGSSSSSSSGNNRFLEQRFVKQFGFRNHVKLRRDLKLKQRHDRQQLPRNVHLQLRPYCEFERRQFEFKWVEHVKQHKQQLLEQRRHRFGFRQQRVGFDFQLRFEFGCAGVSA